MAQPKHIILPHVLLALTLVHHPNQVNLEDTTYQNHQAHQFPYLELGPQSLLTVTSCWIHCHYVWCRPYQAIKPLSILCPTQVIQSHTLYFIGPCNSTCTPYTYSLISARVSPKVPQSYFYL